MIAALAPFHFERPLWLLALLPAVGLWLLDRHGSNALRVWQRVIDPALLAHLVVGADRRAAVTPANALLLVLGLTALAVAGPAWQREPSPFAEAKPAVAVVLKVTPSMLEQDLAPTRLDRARQKLADILAAREGASTSLVAYAGSAHLVLPPTPDSTVVLDLAKSLSPEIMPREGDDLAGALALATRALASQADGGSILIMADEVAAGTKGPPAEVARLPLTILSPRSPSAGTERSTAAAQALNATIVATTADQTDVTAVVRRLDRADQARGIDGEGQHWREAGYWLTPLIALLALLWFRRGRVLA